MSINLHLTVFGTIVFFLAAASTRNVASLSLPLIDLCKVASFPALCRATIMGQTNVNAATEIAIKELMKRTKQAKKIAEKELKREGGVSTCLSNFNSAFYNLEKAIENIKEDDGFSLNINLSAALMDYDTCQDAMKETQVVNAIYKSAGVLYQMADNCLALSTLVK